MEVLRQTCQVCGSRKLRNHLVREPGRQDMVIVQCSVCEELVARYVIASGGYYHHGKDFESYLRGLSRAGESMSGKGMQQDFDNIQQESTDLYDKVLNYLKDYKKGA